jgi:hypothetical protein
MSTPLPKLRALIALAGLALSPAALACGPFLSATLLMGSSEVYLRGPRGDLRAELAALPMPDAGLPPFSPALTAEVEAAQLAAAFPPDDPRAEQIRAFRAALEAWVEADPNGPRPYWMDPPPPRGPPPVVPAGLPAEWALYLEGAVAFRADRFDEAAERWRALLVLPAAERPHKTLWAHFQLGRIAPFDPQGFPALRAAVAAGAPDPLGLALASLGWEARAKLPDAAALTLYVQQAKAGDPGAVASVREVAHELLHPDGEQGGPDPAALARAAADPVAAAAITLALVTTLDAQAHGGPWLDALVAAQAEGTVGADRLAWLAWQAGDHARAARYAEAAKVTPMGSWILARVALLRGDLSAAEAALAATRLPPDAVWTCTWWSRADFPEGTVEVRPAAEVEAERGAVALAAGRIDDALVHLARAGHWIDLAHVAERVAPIDVLEAFVRGKIDEVRVPAQREALRALLGRRLFRAGAHARAVEFLPAAHQADAQAFIAARARGTVGGQVEAARILRRAGMELSGTELAPDYAMEGGVFAFGLERRAAAPGATRAEEPLPPQAAELAAIAESAPVPDTRFHYRYAAAAMMREAADALPDQDPLASEILCEAGVWLADRDPQAADPFYKGVVRRSWGSPLSVAADQTRWFPGRSCGPTALPELPLRPAAVGCVDAARSPAQLISALVGLFVVTLRGRRRAQARAAAR